MDKEYKACLRLGISTSTWDTEGYVTERRDCSGIKKADLHNVVMGMVGDFDQEPPIYSAKKIKGKPAYYYARNKKMSAEEIGLKHSMVKIYSISIESFFEEEVIVKIACSSGTYIRSIVFEIGKKLCCGATLTGLERISIGRFNLKDSLSLSDIEDIALNSKCIDSGTKNICRGIIPATKVLPLLLSQDFRC